VEAEYQKQTMKQRKLETGKMAMKHQWVPESWVTGKYPSKDQLVTEFLVQSVEE
jgi:hypothetical protein